MLANNINYYLKIKSKYLKYYLHIKKKRLIFEVLVDNDNGKRKKKFFENLKDRQEKK